MTIAPGQSLHRGDDLAVDGGYRGRATPERFHPRARDSLQGDGASPADGYAAAEFGARHAQILAQEIVQFLVRVHLPPDDGLVVQGEFQLDRIHVQLLVAPSSARTFSGVIGRS